MSAVTPSYEVGQNPTEVHQEKADLAASSRSTTEEVSGDGVPKKKKLGQLSGVALIFACGASLFSDGYVNAISGPVTTIINGYLYPDATPEERKQFKTLFPSLAFAGTVIGMLSFGHLADTIGRKWGMLICSAGLILFSILAAGAWGAGGSAGGLFAALIAYRFIIGIFIGGEYPCGSVACAENTEQDNIKKSRQQAWFVLATNTCIDMAFIIAPFVALILVWICGMNHLEVVWRVILGLGAIPPLSLLFFRARMHEPKSYKEGAITRNLPWGLIFKKYWVRLTAVSLVWFAYDFVSYPAGIYSSYLTDELFPNASLATNLAFSIALNAFYLGTFLGAAVVDRLGPKHTIMLFLALQAIFGFALAGSFGYLRNHIGGLFVMLGLFIAFGEAGPGNCLGLLASKAVAPTPVRGRMYGIAAAVGKVGAFVGSYIFTPLQDRFPADSNMRYAAGYYLGAALAVFAFILVWLFVPPVVPDGINKMDEEFFQMLRDNGYDMSNVGLRQDAAEPGRISEDVKSD
ncbi:unnamed protein product [Parajaminaea phylloscopi]